MMIGVSYKRELTEMIYEELLQKEGNYREGCLQNAKQALGHGVTEAPPPSWRAFWKKRNPSAVSRLITIRALRVNMALDSSL